MGRYFTSILQEPIPTVESFLHILLEEWNGDDYRHEILNLLTHISLQPFDSQSKPVQVVVREEICFIAGLEEAFLKPLKHLFVSKDREFKVLKYQCLSSNSLTSLSLSLPPFPSLPVWCVSLGY